MDKGRMNNLSGSDWIKYSISVWDDIKKTKEERKLKHSAIFPEQLASRLIRIFTKENDTILDPFMGTGTTLVAAKSWGRNGIGFEINKEFVIMARKRLKKRKCGKELLSKQVLIDSSFENIIKNEKSTTNLNCKFKIYNEDSKLIKSKLDENSIDFVLTSPPYWNIHRQKRTADSKEIRPYSDNETDLGNITRYKVFLSSLAQIFQGVYYVLKPKKFCAVVVMDIRKKDKFYPFHSDLTEKMKRVGFKFEDIIIWNRSKEYNNLRALGYPYVFRVNKIHEYILLFSKTI